MQLMKLYVAKAWVNIIFAAGVESIPSADKLLPKRFTIQVYSCLQHPIA